MSANELPVPLPFWNVISLALPSLAILAGIVVLNSTHRSGDFAGALGGGVLFALGLAAVSVLGGASAIAALLRGEQMAWLSMLGILVNGAFLLPVLLAFAKAR